MGTPQWPSRLEVTLVGSHLMLCCELILTAGKSLEGTKQTEEGPRQRSIPLLRMGMPQWPSRLLVTLVGSYIPI